MIVLLILKYLLVGLYYALKMTEDAADKWIENKDPNANLKYAGTFFVCWFAWGLKLIVDIFHIFGGLLKRCLK